jgi:hypothetical protein
VGRKSISADQTGQFDQLSLRIDPSKPGSIRHSIDPAIDLWIDPSINPSINPSIDPWIDP